MTRHIPLTAVKRVVRAVLSTGIAVSIGAVGCSKKDDPITNNPPSDEIASVQPLASSDAFVAPFDATPDPDGNNAYFTALTAEGPAVFRISAAGGAEQAIHTGAPLSAPFGIMISTDGNRLYIADSATQDDPMKGTGRIFATSPGGGSSLDSLSGAEGKSPRGMDLRKENGSDVLYFTGADPMTGAAAVYKMSPDGSGVTELHKGEPLVSPSGIAVDKNGVVYVADAAAESGGSVYKIENGTISELAGGMAFGHPAGMAFVPSETFVLVSGLDPIERTSQVYKIDVASGQVASFNDGIGGERMSAGLHRAHNVGVYTWAAADGVARGETFSNNAPMQKGKVYLLKSK